MVGLVVAGSALLAWQHRTASLLKLQIVEQRSAAGERKRLGQEHQRLVALQVTEEELNRLRAERTAVSALMTEIETMKRRADQAARDVALRTAPAPDSTTLRLSLREGAVPARLWQNLGQATPDATFESALWASVGGDIEVLARLLEFEPDTKLKAEAIFAKLPPALQRELVSPERFMALLTAGNISPGSAEILGRLAPDNSSGETKIAAKLTDPEGKSKEVNLTLRAHADRWQLVMPADAVERYAAQLHSQDSGR
jgi:hypothetical protein